MASKPERQFSNELGGRHYENLREADEFHHSPMQVEARYLPPRRREDGTLENVAGERPNAARATTSQRIFAQTNPLTQPRAYEGTFLSMKSRGHHASACKSE